MNLPWGMDKTQFKIFLSCTICAFMATFTMVMVSSVIKLMTKSYSIDYLQGIWVAESTTLAAIMFSIITIDLSDKFGKKRIVVTGMVLIIGSSVMGAFSYDLTTLIVSRTISGAGAAMVYSANVSILTDICNKEFLPEILSYNHSATSLGGACGPLFGHMIAESFGLTVLFLSTIPICILAMILMRCADNVVTKAEKKINYPLHLLCIIALYCMLTGLIANGYEYNIMLIIGVILILICYYINKRSKNKILDFGIFQNSTFRIAIIIGLLFTISMYAIDNSMSYYLQVDDRVWLFFGTLAVTTAGLAAFSKGIKPIIQIFTSPTIARISRGKDPTKLSAIGFIMLLIIIFLAVSMVFLKIPEWSIMCCVTMASLLAVANSIFKPMNKSVMMSSVTKEERNTASSMSNIVDNFGKIFGVIVIVNVLYNLEEITILSFNTCLQIMSGMVLGITVLGLYLCIKRKRQNQKSAS